MPSEEQLSRRLWMESTWWLSAQKEHTRSVKAKDGASKGPKALGP